MLALAALTTLAAALACAAPLQQRAADSAVDTSDSAAVHVPSGAAIVVHSISQTTAGVFAVDLKEASPIIPLVNYTAGSFNYAAFSRRTKTLAFTYGSNPKYPTDTRIYVRRFQGHAANGTEPELLTKSHPAEFTGYTESQPAWSPDGSSIAFIFDPSGRIPVSKAFHTFVALVNADGTGWRSLTYNDSSSTYNDLCPTFTPDGAGIVFVSAGRDDCPKEGACVYYRPLVESTIQPAKSILIFAIPVAAGHISCPQFSSIRMANSPYEMSWIASGEHSNHSILGTVAVPAHAQDRLNASAWTWTEYATIPKVNLPGVKGADAVVDCALRYPAEGRVDAKFICSSANASLVVTTRVKSDEIVGSTGYVTSNRVVEQGSYGEGKADISAWIHPSFSYLA